MSSKLLLGDWIARLKELPDESVHCCITSVPYWGLRNYGVQGQIGLEATPAEWIEKLVVGFRELRRVLHPSGTLWLNCGDSYCTKPHGSGSIYDPKWPGARNRGEGNQCNRNLPDACGLKSKDMMGTPWRLALALQGDGWYWRQWMPWIKRSGMPESSSDRPVTACEVVFLFSKSESYFYDAEAVKVAASGTAHARSATASEFPGDAERNSQRRRGVNPKAKIPGPNSRIRVDRDPAHAKQAVKSRQNESFSAAVVSLVPFRMRRNHDWFLESWQGMMVHEEGDPLAFVVNPKGYSEQMCTACRVIYSGSEYKALERTEIEIDDHKRVLAVCKCGKYDYWLSHTATFPRKLAEPMILAGTSEHGCCPRCLNPYERILGKTTANGNNAPGGWITSPGAHNKTLAGKFSNTPRSNGHRRIGEARERLRAETGRHDDYFPQKQTIGWRPTCPCSEMALFPETRPPIPCTVIDVFSGSGTTGCEAVSLGREYIGIDLHPDYNYMAERRIKAALNEVCGHGR